MKICLFLLFPFLLFAQEKNSLLWEISGNGLEKSSYLFGTTHTICSEDITVSKQLRSVITNADAVFFEIDYDEELNDFKAHFDLINKSGKKIKSYYSPQEYLLLEKKFREKFFFTEMRLEQFKYFKPEAILRELIPNILDCMGRKTSYEREISMIAQHNHKIIKGLESFEEHNLFEEESDSLIASNARKLYDMVVKQEGLMVLKMQYYDMLHAYVNQDIEELYSLSIEISGKEKIKKILHDRNQLWIPRIESAMDGKSTLFAVGAGHLGGELGIISLLRGKGYTLKPIYQK